MKPKRVTSRRTFLRPRPLGVFAASSVLLAALVGVVLAPDRDPEGLLARGNAAYASGDYAGAAGIYEEEGSRDDFLVRRFNAGASHLRAGKLDLALARFEEVSARADGELRARALANAGYCRFEAGRAGYRLAAESEDAAKRKEALVAAATSYRAALEFYRGVEPPDEAVEHDLRVAKTALRAALDEIARLEEEERRQREEEALKDPAKLLVELIQREKSHRALGHALSREAGRSRRIGSRRLRQAEAENRVLTERLANYLRRPPAEGEPERSGEEKERITKAAETIARAVESQKEAEVAYQKIEPGNATEHHTRAAEALREARLSFELDVGQIAGEALAVQTAVLEACRQLEEVATGGLAGEVKGPGFGKDLVQTLKDKVLQPLARLLSPSQENEIALLAMEERDVVWAAEILARAEIPPSSAPDPAAGAAPVPVGQGSGPQLDERQAKELSEMIRKEGAAALAAAKEAQAALESTRLAESIPPAETAREALERIVELLPKPPRSIEERLQDLIVRQKEAEEATGGLEGLAGTVLEEAARALEERERDDGIEAGAIAIELEKRTQDDRSPRAAVKVREGEQHIFTAAESLASTRAPEARETIRNAVKALEEALAILKGEEPEEEEGSEEEKEEKQQGGAEEPQKAPQKREDAYSLSPRQAQMLKEEMDQKRREQMEALYVAPSAVTVEKDW